MSVRHQGSLYGDLGLDDSDDNGGADPEQQRVSRNQNTNTNNKPALFTKGAEGDKLKEPRHSAGTPRMEESGEEEEEFEEEDQEEEEESPDQEEMSSERQEESDRAQ